MTNGRLRLALLIAGASLLLCIAGLWSLHKYGRSGCTLPTSGTQEMPAPLAEDMSDSYVSGRDDLSGYGRCPEDDPKLIQKDVSRYFAAVGLGAEDAENLQVAWKRGYVGGIMLRFTLPAAKLRRFLRGKRALPDSADVVLRELLSERRITVTRAGSTCVTTGFDFVGGYPFTRITWWPIPHADVRRMVVYEATMTWSRGDVHPGTPYYVFVDGLGRQVYVVSH